MALYNLIRAYTATVGTGDVTPSTPVEGYLDFTGITGAVSYGLANIDAATGKVTASEVGHGTVTAGVLSRDTVLSSTNGGAKIVLVNAQVFITVLAEDIIDGITQITGDATAGPGSGSQALTLATVNSSPGAIAYPASITVNAKGLITAQTAGSAPVFASLLTTRGDLIYRNATVPDRLALGGVTGSALIRNATDPVWSASAAALVGAANVFVTTQQITVPTTSLEGLILKTSDDNTTKNILEARSSTDQKLVYVTPTAKVYIANATSAHVGTAHLNINDNNGNVDLLDVRYATARVFYVDKGGALTIAPQVPNASQKMITIAPENIVPSGAPVAWWGMDEAIAWAYVPAGTKNLFSKRIVSNIKSTSASTTGLSVYVFDVDMATGAGFSSAMGSYTGFRVYTELVGSSTITNLTFFDIGAKITVKTNTVVNAYGFIIRDIDYGTTLNYSFQTNKGLVTHGDQVTISGWQDIVQSRVLANATQTAPLATWETAGGGAVLVSISGTGVTTAPNFVSNVATGTQPYATTSTTVNTNLNADKVDGYDLNQAVLTTSSPTFAAVTVTAGATGTFTTVDGKTVTITAGIVVSIV